MNNTTLQLKIKQRLNKLASNDYDNIECWQIVEAFNKAQIQWVRRQIIGLNLERQGDEQTTRKIDDLQILLKETPIVVLQKNLYAESYPLPDDYLQFKRISAGAKKDCCKDPMDLAIIFIAEEQNVPILLQDHLKKPSFEWGETVATIMDGRIKIYTDNKFEISESHLIYFRKPLEIQFIGCIDIKTGNPFTADQECEFNDDVAEIIIDNAALIIAGDIESSLQYQRQQQSVQSNS